MATDYPTTDAEITAGELERIEYALRHPAMAEMLEGYDVGPQDVPDPCEIVLYQLIPLREWPRPWVLVMVEWGESIVFAFDSQRAAEIELAGGHDYLVEQCDDAYGAGEAED